MSEHYPRFRIRAESGLLLLRDGLSLCFFMQRPHREVAPLVLHALERYVQAIGPQGLGVYADEEGYLQPLDEAGWERTRRGLLKDEYIIRLKDAAWDQKRFYFNYAGKPLDESSFVKELPDSVTSVAFGLPTEFLEEHGPERVRQLAREIAELLPFNSGHAGLSFNGELDIITVDNRVRERCFRYPGFDINGPFLGYDALHLGTRVRGPGWLTFLGQPVLGRLGGAEGLRSKLRSPGTTVEELPGARALITLGEWPEAGDTEQGLTLPAYRELARVLEPWLYRRERSNFNLTADETKRWETRFLD